MTKHDARDFWIILIGVGVIIGFVALQMAGDMGGDRTMYVAPWLFVLLLFLSALSVSGLLIGVFALVYMALRRVPRRQPKPKAEPELSGIVGLDGKPIANGKTP